MSEIEGSSRVATGRQLPSRRGFLAGSAALLASGVFLAAPGVSRAHITDDPPTDVDILNYALTLEHLEYAFYRDGLKMFTEDDFSTSDLFSGEGKKFVRRSVYEYFQLIRDHERAHVDMLTTVIQQSFEATPVPEATYNFETAFTSVEQFLTVAQALENTGVTAYDGAIAYVEAAQILSAGTTIATVEARHASYLNFINGSIPFPAAFDELNDPAAPRAICEAVQEQNGGFIGFIVSTPEPYGPYEDLERLSKRLPDAVVE